MTFPGELADQTWAAYGHNANLEIGGPKYACYSSQSPATRPRVTSEDTPSPGCETRFAGPQTAPAGEPCGSKAGQYPAGDNTLRRWGLLMFQNRTVLDSIFDLVYPEKPTNVTAIDLTSNTCQHWLLWRWPAAADHRSGEAWDASGRPCSRTGSPRARAGAHRASSTD